MGCCLIFAVAVLEYIDPVDMTVFLTELLPLCIRIHFLYIRIFLNIIIQRKQCTCIQKRHCSISTINKIRIFATCNDCSYRFFCGLSCQPGFLNSDSGLLSDQLLNLVAIIDLGTRHCNEHRKICDITICTFTACFCTS